MPFLVTVQHVPDRELGPLLTQLARGQASTIRSSSLLLPIVNLAERLVAPAGEGRISRRIGGPCGNGRASRINGRKSAITTRATASSSARRAPRAPFTSDWARRFAAAGGGATESTSSPS